MQTGGATLSEAVRAAGQRGIPKLYRGISPAMLEIGINRGALMGLSTHFKTLLPRELPEWASDGAAGVAAGATKTVCLHPLDTLTCRGQVGGAQWALLWPRPQLGALYNGFGPAIARSAGGMGIWLTVRNGMYRAADAQQVKQGWLRDFRQRGAARLHLRLDRVDGKERDAHAAAGERARGEVEVGALGARSALFFGHHGRSAVASSGRARG